MSDNDLGHPIPLPDNPFPDWSRFLKELWMHGMSVQNIDQALAKHHTLNAANNIIEVFTRRNEAKVVRPSAFLACARQTYYSVQGEDPGGMPDNIGTTFAVGHLLHELSYAAIKSALPLGFDIRTELEVSLPDWWPTNIAKFNQRGSLDIVITVKDWALAKKYLPTTAPSRMLIDLKSMGGYSYQKHGRTVWGEDPDPFGYLAQITVYADSLVPSQIDDGVIIAGINRDSLTKPLAPRFITPEELRAELARVKIAIEMALEGSDPGEELLIRHGKAAYFQCGRGGKPGYCAFREVCKSTPTREYGDSYSTREYGDS